MILFISFSVMNKKFGKKKLLPYTCKIKILTMISWKEKKRDKISTHARDNCSSIFFLTFYRTTKDYNKNQQWAECSTQDLLLPTLIPLNIISNEKHIAFFFPFLNFSIFILCYISCNIRIRKVPLFSMLSIHLCPLSLKKEQK